MSRKPLTKQQQAWFDAYTVPHPTDCTCHDLWRSLDPCPYHDQPTNREDITQ